MKSRIRRRTDLRSGAIASSLKREASLLRRRSISPSLGSPSLDPHIHSHPADERGLARTAKRKLMLASRVNGPKRGTLSLNDALARTSLVSLLQSLTVVLNRSA